MPSVREIRPCPDPWAIARSLAHRPHLCFLDSSDRHPTRGRYSYVMADPVEWRNEIPERFEKSAERLPELPPFQGGWVGMVGYGYHRSLEKIPHHRIDDLPTPATAWGRYYSLFAWDHAQNRCWQIGKDTSLRDEASVLPTFVAKPSRLQSESHPLVSYPAQSNFHHADYLRAVQRVVDYVHAGDVFQVNIAQRLTTLLTRHPFEHYALLRAACPAPFSAYFDLGECQILSASPEQFLQVNTNRVVTRPIKGTRPRGSSAADDMRQLHDLTTSPKDRAENVMIVDLMRNDIGRVCEFGSVTVPIICEVESHNYVHHLVSEVRGQLQKGKTARDLLLACFPGGSVTGAPKVRAMEIIAELEPTERGPYCGSLVWIGHDGAMDSNILIRTMTAAHGWLQFPVGGGIVADSIPEREYDETLHKAKGMLRTIIPSQ